MKSKNWLYPMTVVVLALWGLAVIWSFETRRVSAVENAEGSLAQGMGNAFAYALEIRNAEAIIHIQYDMEDSLSIQKYRNANQQRALDLLQSKPVREIEVQITFARPVPSSVVREKAAQTGLLIHDYMLVGRSISGNKIASVRLHTIPLDIPDVEEVILPNGEKGGTLVGVILLKGTIQTTATSLGRWLNDPLVYLADTVSVEARELVTAKHASLIGKRTIQVARPSPFWNLDW